MSKALERFVKKQGKNYEDDKDPLFGSAADLCHFVKSVKGTKVTKVGIVTQKHVATDGYDGHNEFKGYYGKLQIPGGFVDSKKDVTDKQLDYALTATREYNEEVTHVQHNHQSFAKVMFCAYVPYDKERDQRWKLMPMQKYMSTHLYYAITTVNDEDFNGYTYNGNDDTKGASNNNRHLLEVTKVGDEYSLEGKTKDDFAFDHYDCIMLCLKQCGEDLFK